MVTRSQSRAALAALAVMVFCALPVAIVRADDGVDHALDIARPRATSGVGYTLGTGGNLDNPLPSNFDPTDPRVGVLLIAAYGPSPLLLIDMVAANSEDRTFTIGELLASSIGLVISAGALVDSFSSADGTSLAFGAMATAQAAAINMQLLSNGIARMLFGNIRGTSREQLAPTFLPVPFDAGAGIVLRWQN